MTFRRFALPVTIATWSVVVLAGFMFLLSYKGQAGASGQVQTHWPSSNLIVLDAENYTLVMLAHPRCPCTAASLANLERLLQQFPGRIVAHVLFLRPIEVPAGWEQSDLWHKAAAIPGVHLHTDLAGQEAARFGGAAAGPVFGCPLQTPCSNCEGDD